jgi:uncharacterized protein (TIGR03435 family)
MRSIAAIGILACAGAAFAQTGVPGPQFEVASVKVSEPLPSGVMMMRMGAALNTKDPSRVDMKGVTLRQLAAGAYGVKEYQVEGPGWLDNERYDVMAKVPEGQSDPEQIKLMMQQLLAERFHLALHRESKQLNVYTLSMSKPGKLKEVDPTTLPALPEPGSAPPMPPPPPRPGPDGGMPVMRGGALPAGAMQMMISPTGRHVRGNITIPRLCDMMTNFLDRPVIDLTDVKGMYAIDLSWTPTEAEKVGGQVGPKMQMAVARGGGGDSPDKPEASDPGPTLAEALLNTYGLKLEAKKNPADILVIDRAEKVPTEN